MSLLAQPLSGLGMHLYSLSIQAALFIALASTARFP